ncbi:MAG: Fe-Mn family superoxide dismutase [Pseudomonadota bacterium]
MFETKNWDFINTGLEGLSPRLLQAHYGLYQGYVRGINEIEERLKTADRAKANYSFGEFTELKRREPVPLMGTFLHELYFDNLSAHPLGENSSLAQDLKKDFGSLDAWWADAKACALGTVGWCITSYNWRDRKLHNYLVEEHHRGFPAFQVPVIAIDSWEHAFALDYATGRANYLEAFRKLINWEVCQDRYQKAIRG